MLLSRLVRAAGLQGRADRRGRRRGLRRLRPLQGSQGAALLGAAARLEAAGPLLLRRLYGYLAQFAGRTTMRFAQSLLRQRHGAPADARSSPTRRAGPPRSRALAFLSPDMRASIGDWDPLALRRGPPAGRRSRTGARWRATSTSRPRRCWPATCCPRRAIASAMANSIEGRFPYLDHRLIEFANRLRRALQDPRPDREARAAPRAGRPAARGHPAAHQAALSRARQRELLPRRRAAGLRGRPARRASASGPRATSMPARSASCSTSAAPGARPASPTTRPSSAILSTMLLDQHFVRRS